MRPGTRRGDSQTEVGRAPGMSRIATVRTGDLVVACDCGGVR